LEQDALTPETSARLQKMLEILSLQEGDIQASVVGEDVSQFAGSMVNGRINVIENIEFNGQIMSVAKPVVANVLASKAEDIEALQNLPKETRVSVIEYKGTLSTLREKRGRISTDLGSVLSKADLFQGRLEPTRSLAQAYYRWHANKTDGNKRAIARTLIRMLKYEGRQVAADSTRQAEYDAALLAVNDLFRKSKLYRGVQAGRNGEIDLYLPTELRRGGQLAYVGLCRQMRGDFVLNEELEDLLRRERLRNFRMSSAA
jgi:hypothetical protein